MNELYSLNFKFKVMDTKDLLNNLRETSDLLSLVTRLSAEVRNVTKEEEPHDKLETLIKDLGFDLDIHAKAALKAAEELRIVITSLNNEK